MTAGQGPVLAIDFADEAAHAGDEVKERVG